MQRSGVQSRLGISRRAAVCASSPSERGSPGPCGSSGTSAWPGGPIHERREKNTAKCINMHFLCGSDFSLLSSHCSCLVPLLFSFCLVREVQLTQNSEAPPFVASAPFPPPGSLSTLVLSEGDSQRERKVGEKGKSKVGENLRENLREREKEPVREGAFQPSYRSWNCPARGHM